ncbi:MAG: hypothetical protein MRY83_04255 [Flavobacteriales bacterium]|nr:hypothetical protein [Flavobacteriales bacterium]
MIIKKIRLLIIALAFCPQAFLAQTENTLKAEKGDFAVTFGLNGLLDNIGLTDFPLSQNNDILFVKNYLENDLALRIALGFENTNVNLTTFSDVSDIQTNWDSTNKQSAFFISPGIEKHFEYESKRFDPYIGAALSLGLIGNEDVVSKTEVKDTTGTALIETTATIPGGTIFGIDLITGFNFYISKQISLGLEYQFGYSTQSIGGDFETVTVDRPVNGTENITRTVGSDVDKRSGVYFNNMVNISFSYYFGLGK